MIPAALYTLPQWIVWRMQSRDGKATKVPIDPRTGWCAKTSDPRTWSTLADAERAVCRGRYDGLGFVFASGGNLFGIDLDACLAEDGELAGWADGILDRFGTYAEISPSGTGVKLYAAGVFGDTGRRKPMGPGSAGRRPGVEVYGWGRYFCFTGRRWPGSHPDVRCCQTALWELLSELWPRPAAVARPTPRRVCRGGTVSIVERAARALARIEPAVSGQAGHSRTWRAARLLCHDFGLSAAEAFPLLADWNQRCRPPWTDKELLHKLRDAETRAGDRPRGWFVEGRAS